MERSLWTIPGPTAGARPRITAVPEQQASSRPDDVSRCNVSRSNVSPPEAPTADFRPRLPPWVPVLRRRPDQLQLGIDPARGLILSGAPDRFEELLGLLDGTLTLADVRALAVAYGIEPELAVHLVRSIGSAGLLTGDEVATEPPTRRFRVRLVGAGVLGVAIAASLLRAGIDRLDIVDTDPVDPTVYPRPGLATTQADALRLRLRSRRRSAGLVDRPAASDGAAPSVHVARHWTKPDQPAPDLTVIATGRAEPDRAIGEDYVRSDHPHLYVRPLQAGAVVGPFVLPGRTPCLGCLDRVRRDADPAWPGLLTQLCRLPVPVLPMLAAWAASTAVVQIACWAADGVPGTAGSTVELTASDYQLRVRPWPMHPSCGCWWAG